MGGAREKHYRRLLGHFFCCLGGGCVVHQTQHLPRERPRPSGLHHPGRDRLVSAVRREPPPASVRLPADSPGHAIVVAAASRERGERARRAVGSAVLSGLRSVSRPPLTVIGSKLKSALAG